MYISSKTKAENRLLNARKNGLNVNIYRVGNLVGSHETGIFQKNIEDNAFYSVIKAFINLNRWIIYSYNINKNYLCRRINLC